MAITRTQQQNQMKGDKGLTEGKYDNTKDKPYPVDPRSSKPGFPTMATYIEASKEPRHKKRGTDFQRQAKTFGKNG